MRRLVVCCDGTWRTLPEERGAAGATNVARLFACLGPPTDEQIPSYQPGIGTRGGPLRRLVDGAIGTGLRENILHAYRWLAEHYRPGDAIYLFGYSRGAFTVRSLAGMLRYCGLLAWPEQSGDERDRQVRRAYARGYRRRAESRDEWAEAHYRFHHAADEPLPIRFVGVWETVGALGIPDSFALLNLLDNPFARAFHDTSLSPAVATARHALALDERRADFAPTLWRRVADRDVEQVWFAGSHADIGGGDVAEETSNIALAWMIEQSSSAGLTFDAERCRQLRVDTQGPLDNSVSGIFRRLRTRPRAIPSLEPPSPDVHVSVAARRRSRTTMQGVPYRPSTTVRVGSRAQARVAAFEHWNATGIYLEPGNYSFSARGDWSDGTRFYGPDGESTANGALAQPRKLASGALGMFERLWRAMTANEGADFWYTRRRDDVAWMALIGVIANGAATPGDGDPQHEEFLIGAAARRTVTHPGYLYAFANDIWSRYARNRGGITLTVERHA